MKWESTKHLEDDNYMLPYHCLKIEYYEALNALFRIENSLKVFVYIVLKKVFNEGWKDLSISFDDENSTIGSIAKRRLSQDNNHAYLGYAITCPILHLTSGELIRIIMSDSYWKYFKGYFPASKAIIQNKLDEIGNVRNSLAHFRPLRKGDIELVKQNSMHVLPVVERTIENVLWCPDIVPTNTEEAWYKELTILGIENVTVSFTQSKDEKWIKLVLSFYPPEISRRNAFMRNEMEVKAINIRTDKILAHHLGLTKFVISTTETRIDMYTSYPDMAEIKKNIRFTFSKETVQNNYQKIKSEIETILSTISKEVALIKEDNLARGKLTDVISYSVENIKDGHCIINGSNFLTELNEDTPPEFWGKISYCPDFITNTDVFPWMPIEISRDTKLPF